MKKETLLSRIHPVLVRPNISANIGAAVRAGKVMGLGSLRIVKPHALIDENSRMLAAGAIRELKRVRSFDSLEEATSGAVRVYALSARRRDHRTSPVWLEDAARDALKAAHKGTVLFLFGTERTGLENEELDYAQTVVRIPTSSKFRSLNLAQSVMVTAFEILRNAGAEMETYDYMPAKSQDIERCIEALGKALDRRNFFIAAKREMALRRIRDLFGRAVPNENEIALLRGMIRSLDEEPPL